MPIALLRPGFTIAVIGAGAQGAELAWLSLHAGFVTVVEDVFPEKLRNLTDSLLPQLDKRDAANLQIAATVEEAVRDADLAIDNVPDELESKLEIFSLLDRMAPPKTILCSPMIETDINDLQTCTYRADRCIAVRKSADSGWRKADWVNLVGGALTSIETRVTCNLAWLQMGKQVNSPPLPVCAYPNSKTRSDG